MGQTSTPMRILITDDLLAEHADLKPIIEGLREQGHTVIIDDTLSTFHFIAGPNCWYCVPEVAKLFDLALKQGRKVASIEKKAAPKKEKAIKKPKKPAKATKAKKDTVDLLTIEGTGVL